MLVASLELLLFIIILHLPKMMGSGDASLWCDNVEMMKQMGFMNAMKDLGLMGGALILAGIFD